MKLWRQESVQTRHCSEDTRPAKVWVFFLGIGQGVMTLISCLQRGVVVDSDTTMTLSDVTPMSYCHISILLKSL